jgi:hypothetical protein
MPIADAIAGAADELAVSNRSGSNGQEKTVRTVEMSWWRKSLRLSEDFMRDVAALITPGGSAIFMMLRGSRIPLVLAQLRNYGGIMLHTSLNSDQDDKMLAMLAHG